MANVTVGAFIAAGLIILVVSFFVSFHKDKPRLWDHVVRTLGQIGVALLSISIAVGTFFLQNTQQDKRAFAQQANTSAAVLRSTMSELLLEIENLSPLYRTAVRFDCDTVLECDLRGERLRNFSHQLRMLRQAVVKESQYRMLFIEDPKYGDQVRNLVKTTYIFGPHAIDQIIAHTNRFQIALWSARGHLEKINAQLDRIDVDPKSEASSPREVAAMYLSLGALQATQITQLAEFICFLKDIEVSVSSAQFLNDASPLQSIPGGDNENDIHSCSVERSGAISEYIKWDKRTTTSPP